MKKISLTIIIFLIFIISMVLMYSKKNNKILNATIDSKNSMLSIMVESEAGTGNYIDASSFPSTGYYLNKKLSKCVNGSKISFSDGSLSIKGNKTDRCYAYFDKDELGSICKGQNMAECFIKNYQKDASIIYHDGKPDNVKEENYELEAEDLSYRYSGKSSDVHNYICFGSEEENCPYDDLYRIIGLFKNEDGKYEAKLIKADYVTNEQLGTKGAYNSTFKDDASKYRGSKENLPKIGTYYWNKNQNDSGYNNNNWGQSNLNLVNLNQYFLMNYLKLKNNGKWNDLINSHNWIVAGNIWENIGSQNVKTAFLSEIKNSNAYDDTSSITTTLNTPIGLIYVSDYGYAASPNLWNTVLSNYNTTVDNNWLYMGISELTITRRSQFSANIFAITQDGFITACSYANDNCAYTINASLRTSFYLTTELILKSGNGTKNSPYRILL